MQNRRKKLLCHSFSDMGLDTKLECVDGLVFLFFLTPIYIRGNFVQLINNVKTTTAPFISYLSNFSFYSIYGECRFRQLLGLLTPTSIIRNIIY